VRSARVTFIDDLVCCVYIFVTRSSYVYLDIRVPQAAHQAKKKIRNQSLVSSWPSLMLLPLVMFAFLSFFKPNIDI